jgi:hypothetical protein
MAAALQIQYGFFHSSIICVDILDIVSYSVIKRWISISVRTTHYCSLSNLSYDSEDPCGTPMSNSGAKTQLSHYYIFEKKYGQNKHDKSFRQAW